MNNSAPVRVTDRLAYLTKKFEAGSYPQIKSLTEPADGLSVDEFHDEKRQLLFRFSRVENTGNVGMVKHGEGLPLCFKARESLTCRRPGFQNLDGDVPSNRPLLFCLVNNAKSTFTN